MVQKPVFSVLDGGYIEREWGDCKYNKNNSYDTLTNAKVACSADETCLGVFKVRKRGNFSLCPVGGFTQRLASDDYIYRKVDPSGMYCSLCTVNYILLLKPYRSNIITSTFLIVTKSFLTL